MEKPDIIMPLFLAPRSSDSPEYVADVKYYIIMFNRLNGLKPIMYWLRGKLINE